ncbi:MAG: polyprenyl diphosphate synthase [Sphaerochaetaceae bacterium]|jgi:undecaprenyl diphosphate synthase|nr:polyprenyl diphosphate synthase [Sphaerochaetaceae bacterium]NLO60273.1 di-trans,poly-cis-decaprenylcistransferase [Spirochaetales bacterium]MDD2404906.1 polyprenyl diphosphate synthase [Sphaerochaetaceae bacterium]MDD3671576.1 polyprenyl diphosphate synthase [Sphaerochaetaceae bacterium]MDD4259398.1 polyprenyl diphosphate synthase [Sphaerochaetaceae bacterium]
MSAHTEYPEENEFEVLPNHIGIIMDGNGRWATKRALPRTAGHWEGLKAAKRVTLEAARLHIPFITYYVFSTENWKRSAQEVSYLMDLLATRLFGEIDFYQQHDLRVLLRGDLRKLTENAKVAIEATIKATEDNKGTSVILAINHGGQDEIVRTINRWLQIRTPDELFQMDTMRTYCDLPQVPPVDLIVRPGCEKRLSNFLLWDSAYAELVFYDTLWPDWGANQLRMALAEYAMRARRFGGVPT